jgi:hypothetical protein
VFRSLKNDYELLFDNIAEFGGEAAAKDYADVLDDPEADFAKDFDRSGLDIRPVSDPSSITRMQKMAKAQFMLGLLPQIVSLGGDGREVLHRVLEAVDAEDIDKIFPPQQPPDPRQAQMQMQMMIENLRKLSGKPTTSRPAPPRSRREAMLAAIQAQQGKFELGMQAGQHGMELGAAAAHMETPA